MSVKKTRCRLAAVKTNQRQGVERIQTGSNEPGMPELLRQFRVEKYIGLVDRNRVVVVVTQR